MQALQADTPLKKSSGLATSLIVLLGTQWV